MSLSHWLHATQLKQVGFPFIEPNNYLTVMKHLLKSVMLLLIPSILHSQVNLNASALLEDEAGNAVAGVSVFFGALASGAVYTMEGVTDESGLAEVVIELPSGTMQGTLNAVFEDCDSTEVTLSGSFSANALGGLSDVALTGVYCGSEGNDCDYLLEGGPTFTGSWMFMVSGAPEDAVYDWTIDGVTMNNANTSTFEWDFDGEGVWIVCVNVSSSTCDSWSFCQVVDTTDPTGGGDCELSFEVVQSVDAAGEPVPGSLEVIVPELAGQPIYNWDFGDESTSTEANPQHTYAGNGPYLLCLTATWGDSLICTATYCDSVSVDDDGMINFMDGFTINVVTEGNANAIETPQEFPSPTVYPNPLPSGGVISWTGLPLQVTRIEVYDGGGRMIQASSASGLSSISTTGWKSGIYTLRWIGNGQVMSTQVVVQ